MRTLLPARPIAWVRALLLALCFQHAACAMVVKESAPTGPQPVLTTRQGKPVRPYKESHALLISASSYLGVARQGWKALAETGTDMDNVARTLNAHGFHVVRVSDPNSEELPAVIRRFVADHGQDPDNRLVFFFSGHGFTDERNQVGYLVPVDARHPRFDPRDFYRKAMPIETLQIEAKRIVSKHALFFFDSCFSGTIFSSRGDGAMPGQQADADGGRLRFFLDSANKPVRQFVAAGDARQELPAHSRFVPYLIKALTDGSGAQRRDGYITGKELGQYLEMAVPGAPTPQTPHSGTINIPELSFGDMIFQLPAPPAPLAVAAAPPREVRAALRNLRVRAGTPGVVRVGIDDQDNLATAFSRNNEWVASRTAAKDGDVHVYDMRSQRKLAAFDIAASCSFRQTTRPSRSSPTPSTA